MDFIVRGKKIVTDIVSVTYAELAALISTETLIPGQYYKITDYQTVHNIPNAPTTAQTSGTLQIGTQYTINTLLGDDSFRNVGYDSLGVPFIATGTTPSTWTSSTEVFSHLYTADAEALIVFAITTTELAPEAYSETYPQDILYYSFTNEQAVVPGCTKGYIYRRIDTLQNNDFPFDFRNVKFRRWQISQPVWDGVTTYAKGTVVKNPTNNTLWISIYSENLNNEVTTDYWRQFEWDNLSYVSWNADTWTIQDEVFQIILTCTSQYQDYHMFSDSAYYETAYSNTIDMSSGNIIEGNNSVIYGTNFNSNSIGSNFYSNSIGLNFYSNSIGSNFQNNSIGSNFYSNSIGSNFNFNSIGKSFNSNSIGSNFNFNSIGTSFNSNSIGSNFQNNSIGSNFYSNSIGSNFNSNSIWSNFNLNSIGNNITYFSCLLSNIQMNTFEDNNSFDSIVFTNWETHLKGAYNCRILKNSVGVLILTYFSDDNSLVPVTLT